MDLCHFNNNYHHTEDVHGKLTVLLTQGTFHNEHTPSRTL